MLLSMKMLLIIIPNTNRKQTKKSTCCKSNLKAFAIYAFTKFVPKNNFIDVDTLKRK